MCIRDSIGIIAAFVARAIAGAGKAGDNALYGAEFGDGAGFMSVCAVSYTHLVRQQRQDRQDQGQQRRKGSMTSLLLWKEHLKGFYNRYSYGIQPVVRFLFALCTVVSLNTNIGYMAKLKSPLVILPALTLSVSLSL